MRDSLSLFEDSQLGLHLGAAAAGAFALGDLDLLRRGGAPPGGDGLRVVLDGVLAGEDDWHGPGMHVRGSARGLRASSETALLWRLDEARLAEAGQGFAAEALAAADGAIAAASPPALPPGTARFCDADHPEIRQRAAALRRASPAETAEAVFRCVQAMPYRFGAWRERASDTLARGRGMCTTKANLQVALMRAAGLEAGFVEASISTEVLGLLMPSGWLPLMRPTVRHWFAAVKLGGRWHAADASYDDAALDLYIQALPALASARPVFLAEGRPFNLVAVHAGGDPFDIRVAESLDAEMSKPSRFGPRHFEALGVRLDRARGGPPTTTSPASGTAAVARRRSPH